ncbi:MAG: sigma 54-dependent Fis family transcriptional regulator [Proteobacteria bacterium]|nr:sigma 54-dependent Fis family transcriptional regulator [Pseudomonadota bacterium]
MSAIDKDLSSLVDATEALHTRATRVRLQKMSLVISRGPDAGKRVPIKNDHFVVGKDRECELCFSDPTVSRRHFEIIKQSGSFVVRDLESTNGTAIDGTRIKEAFLSPGSRISAGNIELIFQPVYETPGNDVQECEQFGSLVAANPAMKSILGLLRRTASLGPTVLLRGETGVGKSALARAIHDEGPRSKAPFVVFDCASVAPTLIESELFGAEKGAYTGAIKSRPGACEQAQGGTLFLDEIEDLPKELQSKLLRLLDEKEVRRLGSTKPRKLDVNLIAASKTDLNRAAQAGEFRQDLYYRIAVIDIEIPSLRDRREDIPLLCDHFLKDSRGSHAWSRLTPALKEELEMYLWPGNLRELRNVLMRLQCIGPDGLFSSNDGVNEESPNQPLSFNLNRPFKEAKEKLIDTFESEYLQRLLDRSEGRIAPAAREAGLNRKYFYDLLRKHGLYGSKK